MAATTNKTQPNNQSVATFLETISDKQKRADCQELVRIMQEVSGFPPVMWGSSMVGFGTYHYQYASGREGDMMMVGFAPRKPAIVLYGLIFYERGQELAEQLGPHSEGKGCLYIKRLADVNPDILRQMIATAVDSYKAS